VIDYQKINLKMMIFGFKKLRHVISKLLNFGKVLNKNEVENRFKIRAP